MIERCGKFDRQLGSGANCVCCCCGDEVAGVVSCRLQQLDIACETKTHDNVFVTLTINVHFKVIPEHEHDAFYSLEDYKKQINAYVFDTIRSAVPKINLDKVFEQKEDIAIAVKQELSKCMKEYGWEIIQVLIADIEPDPKVKNAMNEINTAQRLRVATVDKAEADKILVVKKAEADAESKYLGGVGIARQRKAIAEGMLIPFLLSLRRCLNLLLRRLWILFWSLSTLILLRKSVRSLVLLQSSFLPLVMVLTVQVVSVRACSRLMQA